MIFTILPEISVMVLPASFADGALMSTVAVPLSLICAAERVMPSGAILMLLLPTVSVMDCAAEMSLLPALMVIL